MPHQSLPATDIVSVFILGRHQHRAECSCSYQARMRWTRGTAVIDALLHACNTGHRENWPLVYNETPPRRSPARTGLAALSVASALLGAALYLASPAQADPADDYATINYPVICETIAERPYVGTVEQIVIAVMADTGETGDFAGTAIGVAVRDYCPWNRPVIERYIAKWTPTEQVQWQPKGPMGGRL